MAVESGAGYPVFPAPEDEHYQAWFDVVTDDPLALRTAFAATGAAEAVFAAIHVQPVTVTYTYVWAGRPTLVGLRGYPAWELITELGATNQAEPPGYWNGCSARSCTACPTRSPGLRSSGACQIVYCQQSRRLSERTCLLCSSTSVSRRQQSVRLLRRRALVQLPADRPGP